MFIVIVVIAFKADVFADNFWGGDDRAFASVFDQAKGTMLITVFVFLGIEGASVYSRFARKREDVGRATVIGFLSVLSVFALVTLVSYGVAAAGRARDASTSRRWRSVLESIVGQWGSIFIRVGVIVSVLGAYLAWTLMAAEILYIPAKTDDMPRFLARTNSNGAPVTALVMAAGLIQLLLIVSDVRFRRARFHARPHRRAVADSLPPRGRVRAEADDHPGDLRDGKSLVARHGRSPRWRRSTRCSCLRRGPDKLLLSCILYAPGAVLYVIARRERNLRVFTPAEAVLFAIIVARRRRRRGVAGNRAPSRSEPAPKGS